MTMIVEPETVKLFKKLKLEQTFIEMLFQCVVYPQFYY